MATMHPSIPDQGTPTSERKVFEILRDDLPAQWTVLHSQRIVVPAKKGKRAVEGESDFLVIDPNRGILVLEVKGGQEVGSNRDGWYSVDSGGRRHAIKDPAKQAQSVMHRFRELLEERRGWPVDRYERRIGFGVVFPGFDVHGTPPPGLPREFVLDCEDLKQVRTAIDRLFDANDVAKSAMHEAAAPFVVEVLSPIFRCVRTLSARIGDQEQVLVQLTDEQFRVVEASADNPRVVVRGGAGSGKTLVAMEMARQFAEAGKRTLLLCFNAPLAAHLARRAVGFEVKTFHKKCLDLIRGAGLSSRLPAEHDEAFFRDLAPELMEEALARLPDERWDAVLVDEGQDFLELWWIPIEQMLRDPATSTLFAFWDPNQDLYGGGPGKGLGQVTLTLGYNCRNTKRIGEFAASLVADTAKFRPMAPEGDAVERITVADAAAMADAVRRVLHRVVREENVPTEDVVVLSTVRPERSALPGKGKLGPFTFVNAEVEKLGPEEIRFSTIHRFKGLEADVVVLCDVAPGEAWSGPKLLHVGASRAKHYLVEIAYAGKAP